jgi:V8-like Glu-specific endopeptidase
LLRALFLCFFEGPQSSGLRDNHGMAIYSPTFTTVFLLVPVEVRVRRRNIYNSTNKQFNNSTKKRIFAPSNLITMKKISLLLLFCCLFAWSRADEGMWLPVFLNYNEAEMQQLGFKLTAEDVYSVNHHSMKDAIVLFGGGCTAELISSKGLLLTNHHCGYSYVQRYSTLEHNYLHNGFWAKSFEEEIPCEGLSVTFLVEMRDVSKDVLEGVNDNMGNADREKIINANIEKLKKELVKGTHYTVDIKSFYYGNQYFAFINETYHDIRLVGTPPESIGKFGGDTDNWMWPRHTGDFSMYRIYANKNNQPAAYSKDNVPFTPKKYFTISTKGVEENDFTLVFGYPGTTQQFIISDAVDMTVNDINPVAIHQRGTRLDIMKKYQNQSTEIRLMYSAKSNSISNGWKKWIGESKGLKECKVVERKQAEEAEFEQWLKQNPEMNKQYGNVLSDLKKSYSTYRKLNTSTTYFYETFWAVEMMQFMYRNCSQLIALAYDKATTNEQFEEAKAKVLSRIDGFYKSYYKPIDKECFIELMYYYFTTMNPELMPQELRQYTYLTAPGLKALLQGFAEDIYEKSVYKDAETFKAFLQKANKKAIVKLDNDVLFKLLNPAMDQYVNDYEAMREVSSKINNDYRLYVKALMLKEKDKTFYPDANLTMRVTYGQVKGFHPQDGKDYIYYTTLAGVIEKDNPDIFDYKVDPKLKQLYEAKDYGRYANSKGEMPVAFIASNHTTGGNSGSPVINANGELIGVNFDRVWEGTMSDINYDVNRCRNISLDIRYFLFIVDKFAGAQNLLNEMTLN